MHAFVNQNGLKCQEMVDKSVRERERRTVGVGRGLLCSLCALPGAFVLCGLSFC